MVDTTIQPIVRIGKSGITETVIKQIKDQLKKKEIIKVKFLPSSIKDNKKELAEEIASKTNSKLVKRVGFTAILERIKNKNSLKISNGRSK